MYKRYIKRGLDIIFSLLSLFFLSPVYLITAAAIRLESGSPVIFRQITRVGRILRATSIDELPQAVNILKGDMSLIGPRPPLTYHPWPVNKYSREELRMFEVRPGITGWAQVHGRKDVEWHKRIRLNVWYVDHCSFLLDLKILIMTVFKVFTNADNENKGETVKSDSTERQ